MQEKGQSLREALKIYHEKAAGKCHVDVAFHLVITDPTPEVLGRSCQRWSKTAIRPSRSS